MGSILSLFFGRQLPPAQPEATTSSQAEAATEVSDNTAEASALRENIQRKGENAYYYAHNRKFEVPPDAKVISGPGLVTGGPPVKLDIEANGSPIEEKRVEAIRSFSFADDGPKVKIYLQLPEGTLQDASQVTCDFQDRSFHLQVASGNVTYTCKMDPLYGEIVPDACSYRSNMDKSKVTVIVKKSKNQPWYELKKS
mmetsp:Transcript_13699/g.16434  ORF Transcript_13699/g.16434 Transcript_13699/m.16434 type:complete len:197 (-) Transcript_13699:61-651(-)|eukprot:Skav221979  [mRNA]  locus=scaffold195:1057083:1061907:- [translate_table: standard]